MSVYCIGETVLDIIIREGTPVAAKPGGSMLNSAVSLGRAGVPVNFISDFSRDQTGDIIDSFLVQNMVGTQFIDRYNDGKTTLALAFLDQKQDAEYSFYKIFPKKRLNISMPVTKKGDFILFGSSYALIGTFRKKLTDYISKARSDGAFILYDPNFRKLHLAELKKVKPWIIENIGLSSMVRGSDEDFLHIFGVKDARSAFDCVAEAGCPILIYTRNKEKVEVVTKDFTKAYSVKPIVPVSTIGAGDAFNAGIIFALTSLFSKGGSIRWPMSETLTKQQWEYLIKTGISFSSNVCQSLDNYISQDYANQLMTNHPS